MTDQTPRSAPADDDPTGAPRVHLATPEDHHAMADRDARFAAVLERGDDRDREAERRDRRAEASEASGRPHVPWIDRSWAGRDRDGAATDRADLIEILRSGSREG